MTSEIQPLGMTSPQPDVQAALDEMNSINTRGEYWASFWAAQFDTYRVVQVEVGPIVGFDRHKEACIQTINFYLNADNTVTVVRNDRS